MAPMNAEPMLPDLVKSWVTPVESFFIRSHGNTPEIKAEAFRLTIEGLVERPLTLSLAELGQFEQHSTTATLTCAGNRRSEHSRVKPVKGVQWREGAIGNAKWSGARLSDLLKKAGLRESARHIWFEGLDTVEDGGKSFSFGGSIPLEKALLDRDGVPGAILATMMNDKPLTADHGFPVRSLVPGYIGARSVKWLSKIVVSDRPSPNHFVADVYKLVDEGTLLEVAENAPIYRIPLNSAICTPTANAAMKPGRIAVAGYVLPPGVPGVSIRQVELSTDGGKTWSAAKVTPPVSEFCWQLWSADVPVTSQTQELVVRATDSRGDTQPQTPRWNVKGYLFNGWHRVPVKVG
jgi:sulfite oxidase